MSKQQQSNGGIHGKKQLCLPSPTCPSPASRIQSFLWLRDAAISHIRKRESIQAVRATPLIRISWDFGENLAPRAAFSHP
ncbi:hypothetical protein R3W88_012697 [Solanum pinnatisectum]|uniref:Uncharacterized protein n=1 Tax=Solanum pinnatisectum TaxID=50273 RepID=A0AAV9LCL7_9SOLN|nr:hypothetical protein R3W88_012697 [Solanum pinnatisectum]